MDSRVQSAIVIVIVLTLALVAAVLITSGKNAATASTNSTQKLSLDTFYSTANIVVAAPNGTITKYSVYIASTPQQQEQGYMNQTGIGNCAGRPNCIGMVFTFLSQSQLCFWMDNTEIPLEQSWLNANGIVTYVYNGTPYSTEAICANGTDVIETTPGQIREGSAIEITR